jgi:hypothetical protein
MVGWECTAYPLASRGDQKLGTKGTALAVPHSLAL